MCGPAYSPGCVDEKASEAGASAVAREPDQERAGRPAAGAPGPTDGAVSEVEPRSEQAVADRVHLFVWYNMKYMIRMFVVVSCFTCWCAINVEHHYVRAKGKAC